MQNDLFSEFRAVKQDHQHQTVLQGVKLECPTLQTGLYMGVETSETISVSPGYVTLTSNIRYC